ncbi:MAG: hypothetical protein JWQ84_163 [Mucilaginibacter sp.]|nr:hypothetical protein [Mucilaginibacter sp.]MDB5015331.1 hypothetical protein [Mucilaginibacter sp.]
MRSFLLKLNVRQLIIHFIASWLFIYAFYTLTSLYDYSFLYNDAAMPSRMIFKQRFANDMFILRQGGNLGLIIAYFIMWKLAVKRNWFWVNSVIVFLVTFALYNFNLLGWKSVMWVFLYPGQVVFKESSLASIIVNGIVMLTLGCFLFFKKQISAFIDRGAKSDKQIAKLVSMKKR